MLKKSKIVAGILAVSMFAAAFLTGCVNGKTGKEVVNQTSEGEVPKDPYEIVWYFLGNANQADISSVEEEVNKYIKPKLNATVKMNSLDFGTYNNKVNMMLATNETLDLLFTASWAANYNLNVSKGALLPLNDLIDKYAPKTKALLGAQFMKGPEIDGKLYAVQANKDKAHNMGFIYRKDIAEKYNIDMSQVKTLEDLEPILKLVQSKEPTISPFGATGGRNLCTLLDFDFTTLGGLENDNSNKIINVYETPEYKATTKIARKYYEAGYVRKDAGIAKSFSQLQKEGSFFTWCDQLKPGKAEEMSAQSKGIVFAQQDFTKPVMAPGDTVGSMMGIPRNCKNPERVMMFIEMLNTDKYLNNLINYGIENKHYVKKSDNVIEVNKNAGYSQVGAQWMFGNVFLNYLTANENPNKFKDLAEYNEKAVPSKTFGFNFVVEPVKTEVAACENVKTEFTVVLETGAVNPEEYLPKFLEKLKQAGSEKVIAEMQKQYDAWLLKKNK